jgi:hypothetical protein
VLSVVGNVPVYSAAYGNFVNLEDLLIQSLKMLIDVGFAFVYS